MNREQLFEAIGQADPIYLVQSETIPRKKRLNAIQWVALAACAVFVIGLAGLAALVFAPAGSSTPGASPADSVGSTEGDSVDNFATGSIFTSYAGPVLPLTLSEPNGAITAQRHVTLDFSPYGGTDEEHLDCCRDLLVTDAYTLTNTSDQPQTFTVLYPYVSSYRDCWEREPALVIDGRTYAPASFVGDYLGGYYSVDPTDPDRAGERWNLRAPQTWGDYQTQLADGSYQSAALAGQPLSDLPVIVYAFSDIVTPEGEYDSAVTLGLKTSFDDSRTTVLTYNFNGQQWDEKSEQVIYDFFADNAWRKAHEPLTLLIVVGDDLPDYTIQGYADGSCDKEIDGVSATVTRTETTLGNLMLEISREHLTKLDYYDGHEHLPPTEETVRLFAASVQHALLTDGHLSATPAERYDSAYLDMLIGDTHSRDRIFYLKANVTIPAGESATVTATLRQPHSFNHYGSGMGNENVDGYDLTTVLGSNLTFTTQTATLENAHLIQIVRQNYGFDPANGVTTAELDPAMEHYYLEVTKPEE